MFGWSDGGCGAAVVNLQPSGPKPDANFQLGYDGMALSEGLDSDVNFSTRLFGWKCSDGVTEASLLAVVNPHSQVRNLVSFPLNDESVVADEGVEPPPTGCKPGTLPLRQSAILLLSPPRGVEPRLPASDAGVLSIGR